MLSHTTSQHGRALFRHPNLHSVSSADDAILDVPTAITRGLVAEAA